MTQKSAADLANEMSKILGGQDSLEAGNAIILVLASFIQALGVDEASFEDGCMSIALDAAELAKSKPSILQ